MAKKGGLNGYTVQEAQNASLGQAGVILIDDQVAHTGPYVAITALEDAAVDVSECDMSYIEDVADLGYGGLVFSTLYNSNQTLATSPNLDSTDEIPLPDIIHKFTGNVEGSATRFNIQSDMHNSGRRKGDPTESLFPLSTFFSNLGTGTFNINDYNEIGNEPYIIRNVGTRYTSMISHIESDLARVKLFLSSPVGKEWVATQKALATFQQYTPVYDETSTIISTAAAKTGMLGIPIVTVPRDAGMSGLITSAFTVQTYTDWLNRRQKLEDALTGFATLSGNDTYAEMERKKQPLAYAAMGLLGDAANWLGDAMFGGDAAGSKPVDRAGIKPDSGINAIDNMQNSMNPKGTSPLGKGDQHTLARIVPSTDLDDDLEFVGVNGNLGKTTGMPLYFVDMRDTSYIFFRGYVEGLSDAITPTWSSQKYIGRSEPVFIYEGAERELSFTLKLAAQSKDELMMIYKKINRLTSMCYPEYTNLIAGMTDEESAAVTNRSLEKVRMKPPLAKFRMGDLWGTKANEMVGFLKALNYSWPDESPWEIQDGFIVPKFIDVEIGFQVVHNAPGSYDFANYGEVGDEIPDETFYGINQNDSMPNYKDKQQ